MFVLIMITCSGFLQGQRRSSDVGGKKNFRSKRFSRNLERDAKDPTARRSHSLHVERTVENNNRWVELHTGMIKKPAALKPVEIESIEELLFGNIFWRYLHFCVMKIFQKQM